ncbi:hypothetical protein [Telmatospirillum sp. J64-1]|uniref:DUF6925 family protein n=1 Tax=Telmatospirillum sp. J64-1 TaxID=2502183 RepID=UPI00115DE12E|nr:hypothetical protein [Telmatospirillum sp. J64-1]
MTEHAESFQLLKEHLRDSDAAWSVGSFGAIAEFMRDATEAVEIAEDEETVSAVTDRGGLRLSAWPGLRLVAYEHATTGSGSWSQAIALCLPRADCSMSERRVLTELGPDEAALRPQDRRDILFDLGLGQPQVDACIRTGNPDLIASLRKGVGQPLFTEGNPLQDAILAAAPHRVFLTRFARAEVFQPIPPPDGESPQGPHTHILPKLLQSGQTHAATAPIPEGWCPAAHLFPAHPAKDLMGHPQPFHPGRHARFQVLLERHGLAELNAYKGKVLAALKSGETPPSPSSRYETSSLRATLAQWAAAQG